MTKKFYTIIILSCFVLNIIIVLLTPTLLLQTIPLLIANFVLLIISIISFRILVTAASHTNPRKFVNSMLLNTLIRLMSCAIGMLIFVYFTRNNISKSTVFSMMALYAIYSIIDSKYIMQLSKKPETN
jgi:hypothetical protein